MFGKKKIPNRNCKQSIWEKRAHEPSLADINKICKAPNQRVSNSVELCRLCHWTHTPSSRNLSSSRIHRFVVVNTTDEIWVALPIIRVKWFWIRGSTGNYHRASPPSSVNRHFFVILLEIAYFLGLPGCRQTFYIYKFITEFVKFQVGKQENIARKLGGKNIQSHDFKVTFKKHLIYWELSVIILGCCPVKGQLFCFAKG